MMEGERNSSHLDNFWFSGGSCHANCLIFLVRRLSSGVEQRFCKPLVAGSNPAAGTRNQ
jgi:hypothetical protein